MKQKVELTVEELAGLIGDKRDEEKPHIAQANKDDYVRLAKLKLEKQFEPRIQALQNKVQKAKEELLAEYPDSKRTSLAYEQVRSDEKVAIDKAVRVVKALNKAGRDATVGLEEFVGTRIPEFLTQLNENVSVNVLGVTAQRVTATIIIADQKRTVDVASKKSVKDFIKERAAKQASVAKAEEDLEILMKCQTKAEKAVLGEVEESLLSHMIGKVPETKEIQADINARVDEALKNRLLSAGEEV